MYAAGKIPGGFFKREGRPTERAILTARMIDRPVRPLWPKGYRNETQGVATVFSADMVNAHDILAINAVSAALTVSPLPFLGPIGAVRMGIIDGNLVVNPTLQELEDTDLDLIVVGTKDGLTMVEAGAKQVHEDKLLEALEIAHREIIKLCDAQLELRAKKGKTKWLDPAVTERLESTYGHSIWERIQQVGLREAAAIVEEIVEKEVGAPSLDANEEKVFGELQVRMSLAQILEKQRSVAVETVVREKFENDLQGPHRRRAGLEGAQVGEAQPASSSTSSRASSCRSRSARPPSTVTARSSRTRSRRATSRRRARRSTRASSARRSPCRRSVPTAGLRRRSARSRSRSA